MCKLRSNEVYERRYPQRRSWRRLKEASDPKYLEFHWESLALAVAAAAELTSSPRDCRILESHSHSHCSIRRQPNVTHKKAEFDSQSESWKYAFGQNSILAESHSPDTQEYSHTPGPQGWSQFGKYSIAHLQTPAVTYEPICIHIVQSYDSYLGW